MLCLRFKVGQPAELRINGHKLARVMPIEITGGSVVLGFDADPEIDITRPQATEKETRHGAPVKP